MRVPQATFAALKRKIEARKAKRLDNATFIRKAAGKPRLPSLATLKKKLWDLNTQIVRRRDGPLCRACGKNPGYAQNHIVPQQEGDALRYELDNIFWGCRGCNYSESNYRGRWQKITFPQIFGHAKVSALWARSRVIVQFRRPDYERMIAHREALLGKVPVR